jgi:hypothetical protein
MVGTTATPILKQHLKSSTQASRTDISASPRFSFPVAQEPSVISVLALNLQSSQATRRGRGLFSFLLIIEYRAAHWASKEGEGLIPCRNHFVGKMLRGQPYIMSPADRRVRIFFLEALVCHIQFPAETILRLFGCAANSSRDNMWSVIRPPTSILRSASCSTELDEGAALR